MSRPRWCSSVEPVTVEVDAGDAVHRLSWRAGRLVLHDHDVAAEEVLQALGGEPCVCLVLRDAFRGLRDQAGGAESLGVSSRWRAYWTTFAGVVGMSSGQARSLTTARNVPTGQTARPMGQRLTPGDLLKALQSNPMFVSQPVDQRTRMLAQVRLQMAPRLMPDQLVHVFSLAQGVHADRRRQRQPSVRARPTTPTPEERLQAAAVPALEQAMRQAQAYLRPQASITVGCWKDVPGEPPVLQGDLTSRGGFVAVSLPLRWLNRVWARKLAVVDGHFVLDVDAPAPATDVRGDVLRWQRGLGGHTVPTAVPCRIVRRGGVWQLIW